MDLICSLLETCVVVSLLIEAVGAAVLIHRALR